MFNRIKLLHWSNQNYVQALKPLALGQGLVWALLATLFISAALSFWAIWGTRQVYHFSSIVAAGVLVGAFLGGTVSGQSAGRHGLMHGAALGIVYGLVLTMFLAAWGGVTLSLPALLPKMFWPGAAGALGGVVGVNIKHLSQPNKYPARMP